MQALALSTGMDHLPERCRQESNLIRSGFYCGHNWDSVEIYFQGDILEASAQIKPVETGSEILGSCNNRR